MERGRLRRFARDWNNLAQRNPFGAILTERRSGTASDWDAESFFSTGRADVQRFIEALVRFGPDVRRRRALDFGCGVGRIARWLATYFDSVVGVDVAPAMIEQARALNAHLGNCEFILNREPHLRRFDTGSFDVIYSRLVLQHIPPAVVPEYVAELIRVLSPGGMLMFQLPERIESPLKLFLDAPVTGGRLKRALPSPVVRVYRSLKYLALLMKSGPRMRMSGTPYEEVDAVIRQSGGLLVAAVPDASHGIPGVAGFEYWVTKPEDPSQG